MSYPSGPTKTRQAAAKRAAARKLNGLTQAPAPSAQKHINGNTLIRVRKALEVVQDANQPTALRLRNFAWLRELCERFERTTLTGAQGQSHTVPEELYIPTIPEKQVAVVHAVQTLCSAHGYERLLRRRVWVYWTSSPAADQTDVLGGGRVLCL